MKKLILAAVLLSGMTFVACSSDDDNGSSCVTCTITIMDETQTEEFCRSDFDSDEEYDQAIEVAEAFGSCS